MGPPILKDPGSNAVCHAQIHSTTWVWVKNQISTNVFKLGRWTYQQQHHVCIYNVYIYVYGMHVNNDRQTNIKHTILIIIICSICKTFTVEPHEKRQGPHLLGGAGASKGEVGLACATSEDLWDDVICWKYIHDYYGCYFYSYCYCWYSYYYYY